jgi:hypothetical protein
MRQTYSTTTEQETLVWSVPRLWELARDLPVTSMDLQALASELDSVCWFDEEELPTVRAVALHAKRIFEADLDYPILLSASGHVMDGMHRLAKAAMLGRERIAVVRFEVDPEPDQRISTDKAEFTEAASSEESRFFL